MTWRHRDIPPCANVAGVVKRLVSPRQQGFQMPPPKPFSTLPTAQTTRRRRLSTLSSRSLTFFSPRFHHAKSTPPSFRAAPHVCAEEMCSERLYKDIQRKWLFAGSDVTIQPASTSYSRKHVSENVLVRITRIRVVALSQEQVSTHTVFDFGRPEVSKTARSRPRVSTITSISITSRFSSRSSTTVRCMYYALSGTCEKLFG